MKKIILSGCLILSILIAGLVLKPVPIVKEDEALTLSGKVEKVCKGSGNDIVLSLKGIDKSFYINRGLERGIDFQTFVSEVMNNEIELKYPSYWTPLDPTRGTLHVSKISIREKVLFNELQ